MKRCIIIAMGLCLLLGCRDTETPKGIPVWQGTYMLWEQGNSKHLGVWAENNWRPQAEEAWLSASSLLMDMTAGQQDLWILSQSPALLQQVDLPSGEVEKSLTDIPLSSPAYVAAGPDNLMVTDSLGTQLAFWSKRNETWISDTPASAPGLLLFRAGHYYVATAAPAVEVWNATALTRVATLPLEGQVISLQADARNTVWVQTLKDSLLHEAGIEINSRTFIQTETQPNFLDQRYSPFIRQQFGTEYTRPVLYALDSVVRPGNLRNTPDFEPDFFGGDIYYVQRDSLWTYSIRDIMRTPLAPFSGHLLKIYPWWDLGL